MVSWEKKTGRRGIPSMQPSASSASSMIPQGSLVSKTRWLLIARVGWVAVTLLIVILNVAMLPSYDAILQAHCQAGSQCFAIQLTPYDRQLLHQLGLTADFLAAYQVMLDATSVLICCALGTL